MIPVADNRDQATLIEQFETLATQWKADVAVLSSTTAMITHPAYQAIIAPWATSRAVIAPGVGTRTGSLV